MSDFAAPPRRSSRRREKKQTGTFQVGDIVEITRARVRGKVRLVSKLTEETSSNPRWLVAFDDESYAEEDMYESSFGAILGKATSPTTTERRASLASNGNPVSTSTIGSNSGNRSNGNNHLSNTSTGSQHSQIRNGSKKTGRTNRGNTGNLGVNHNNLHTTPQQHQGGNDNGGFVGPLTTGSPNAANTFRSLNSNGGASVSHKSANQGSYLTNNENNSAALVSSPDEGAPTVAPSTLAANHSNQSGASKKKKKRKSMEVTTGSASGVSREAVPPVDGSMKKSAAAARAARSLRRQAKLEEEHSKQQKQRLSSAPPHKRSKHGHQSSSSNHGKNENAVRVTMLTGTLLLYRGSRRRAEFVYKK